MALIPVQPPGPLVELPTPSDSAIHSARQLGIPEAKLTESVVPVGGDGAPIALHPRMVGDIVCAIADSTSGATIEQVVPYLRGMGTELCAVMYQTLGNVIGHFMMTQVSRMEALSEDHKNFLTHTAGLMTSYMQQDGHQNRQAVIASVQYGHDMIQHALVKHNKESHGALVALHTGIDRQLVEQNVSRDAQFANLNTALATCFRAVSHKIEDQLLHCASMTQAEGQLSRAAIRNETQTVRELQEQTAAGVSNQMVASTQRLAAGVQGVQDGVHELRRVADDNTIALTAAKTETAECRASIVKVMQSSTVLQATVDRARQDVEQTTTVQREMRDKMAELSATMTQAKAIAESAKTILETDVTADQVRELRQKLDTYSATVEDLVKKCMEAKPNEFGIKATINNLGAHIKDLQRSIASLPTQEARVAETRSAVGGALAERFPEGYSAARDRRIAEKISEDGAERIAGLEERFVQQGIKHSQEIGELRSQQSTVVGLLQQLLDKKESQQPHHSLRERPETVRGRTLSLSTRPGTESFSGRVQSANGMAPLPTAAAPASVPTPFAFGAAAPAPPAPRAQAPSQGVGADRFDDYGIARDDILALGAFSGVPASLRVDVVHKDLAAYAPLLQRMTSARGAAATAAAQHSIAVQSQAKADVVEQCAAVAAAAADALLVAEAEAHDLWSALVRKWGQDFVGPLETPTAQQRNVFEAFKEAAQESVVACGTYAPGELRGAAPQLFGALTELVAVYVAVAQSAKKEDVVGVREWAAEEHKLRTERAVAPLLAAYHENCAAREKKAGKKGEAPGASQ